MVDEARAPFLSGQFRRQVFTPAGWKPGTGYVLDTPLDTVVGRTDGDLHRWHSLENVFNNFAADAMRELTGADIGIVNGFRFDIPLPPGEITVGDLFYFFPISPAVAVAEFTGGQLLDRLENSLNRTFDPNPYRQEGGWTLGLSGLRVQVDFREPQAISNKRVVGAEVLNRRTGQWEPLDRSQVYTVASCYGHGDPPDRICATNGARNLRFLTTDMRLVPPLVRSMPPNPKPKVQAAPENVMFPVPLLIKYLQAKGGLLKTEEYATGRWQIVGGQVPAAFRGQPFVQPVQGAGPEWLAGRRVTE